MRWPPARVAIATLFACDGASFGMWAGHVASIRTALDLSPATLSIALLGLVIGAIVSMPITGALVERVGMRRVVAGGALTSLPALALPGLAPTLPLLVAAAVVYGATRGVVEVAMNAAASDLQARMGRPIFSSMHAGFSLGGMIGAAAASVALGLGGAPQDDLPAMAALVTLVAVCLLPATADFGRAAVARRAHAGSAVSASGGGWTDRAVLVLGGAAFCGLVCEGAAADWSGVYVRSVFGTAGFIAPLAYTGFSLAMATGRIFGDRIQHAVAPVPLMAGCGSLAIAGAALVALAPSVMLAIAGFTLLGAALANVIPLLFGTAGRLGAANAIATVSTIGYAGFICGPPLIGGVAQTAGLRVGVALLVVFATGMLLLSLRSGLGRSSESRAA